MVNSTAQAYVDNPLATAGFVVSAGGGALKVRSQDNSGIAANSTVISSSTATSDGAISIAANFAKQIGEDYQFTTKSGSELVQNGDQVRLADDYAGGWSSRAGYK